MLVTGSVNKVSKIHERSSGDVSPFQYEYAKLDANVCDGGMNVEQRMTCRSRSFHFRAATALHTSERSVKRLLRMLLVEAAQGAVQCDPGFRNEYLHRCHKKAKGVAKVAAARKLAIRLYWMLRTNTGPSSSTFSQAGRRSGTANLT